MKSFNLITSITIFILSLISFFCRAQESFPQLEKIIPPSPTAASLGMYAEVPVTLYTGSPSIHIPLWEVRGRKLSFTISLDYHASGIKVNDIAGWTGLGWSLHAGGIITRTVRGIADDLPMGYFTLHGNQLPLLEGNLDNFGPWEPPGADDQEMNLYLSEIADGRADSEPDIFFFNVNGRSGKIVMNVDGRPVVSPHQNLAISFDRDQSGNINSWQIIDENGTIYLFGTREALEISTPIDEDGSRRLSFFSSWYLNQIRSPNNEDMILFSYNDYHINRRDPLPQRKEGNSDPKWDDLQKYCQTDIEGKYLREIEYSKGSILFETTSFGSYLGGEIIGLKRITIKDRFFQQVVKAFQFDYSFFETANYGQWYNYLPPSRRLRLDKVTEISANGNETKPPHMFFYNSTPLPPRGSYSQDHWGYFNGADNEYFIPEVIVRNYHVYDSIPPSGKDPRGENIEKLIQINLNLPQLSENIWRTRGANREPDAEFMQTGILNRIVYPTGGSTLFEFEPHDFGYFSIPRKPLQSMVSVAHIDSDISASGDTRFLEIPYGQKIKIIPLFYILKGSIKDKEPDREDIPPSDHSRIFIVKEPEMDEIQDTIFNLSFKDYETSVQALEAVYEIWVTQGRYEIGALSDEVGDYTKMIIHSGLVSQFDDTFPIYSNDYKDNMVMAGNKIWIDNESHYCSEVVAIGKEDENLVQIEYLFRSFLHPNQPSTFGLDILLSKVRIRELNNPESIIFETVYYGNDQITWDSNHNEWILQKSFSKLLRPGKYLIEFIPRLNSEMGYISLTWRKTVATHNRKIAGGVRVKKIIEIDNESDTIGIKEFNYTVNHNGIIRSSGILQSWPVYSDLPDQIYYLNNDGIPSNISYAPITLYSSGKSMLGSTQGSHVGYRQVDESNPLSGKTVHCFTSAWEYPDITSLSFPYPNATSFDWKRGLEEQTIKYSNEGIVREIETIAFNQLEDSFHLVYTPALVIARKFPESNSAFIYGKYANVSSWNHPIERNVIRFDINGENPLKYGESYEYDPSHLQIKQIERVDSDSSIYTEKFHYPGDPGIEPSEVITGLISKHMVNVVLKKETIKNTQLIAGSKTNYEFFNGSQLFPASNERLEGTEYELKMIFDRYDDRGNLLQYHAVGGLYHSINWGWDGNYPIADITNSVYKDNIVLYSEDSRMTKYTYLPMVGIRSETTPDEISTFYEYDDFGRLTLIKNHDQKILRSINYHYKPYKGDTTRTYWASQNLVESIPAESILTNNIVIAKNCPGTLAISGGSLGSNAEWDWFKGSCGGTYIGSGPEIEIFPLTTTMYYVRASGDANTTVCCDITIEVIPASFNLLLSELNFDYKGNVGNPTIIETNYTGCDPWYASEATDWISIINKNDNNFAILCDQNDNPTPRTGKIFLNGDGQEYVLPVHQTGSIFLEFSDLPSFIQSGDDVTVSVYVSNSTSPYQYRWETRPSGTDTWAVVRDHSGIEPSDTLLIPSVTTNFEVRCSVLTGGKTISGEMVVIVAE